MKTKLQIAILFICILSSCAEKSNINHPEIEIKAKWNNANYGNQSTKFSANSFTHKEWWKSFNDKNLNQIIELAIKENLDHKLAIARIREARADKRSSSAELTPQLNLLESTSSTKNIKSPTSTKRYNLFDSSIDASKRYNLFDSSIDASWEIDLFNTQSYIIESKDHILNSYLYDRNKILLTLISDIIINYTDYLKYKKLININIKRSNAHKHMLDLVTAKHLSGISSELEFAQEKAQYLKVNSDVLALNTELKKSRHSIETLCGIQAGTSSLFQDSNDEISIPNQKIIVNAPIEVIRNRPDIKKAEYELLSATSLAKSAITEQYPKLLLLGSLGLQNSSISGTTEAWGIGQSIVAPILNFKSIRANINVKEAQEEQAFLKYQKSVLGVIEEVESNMAEYYNSTKSYDLLEAARDSRKKSLELTKHLYENKTNSYHSVLNAETDIYDSEEDLANIASTLVKASVKMYKSLGYNVI